ncbi:MAG TPA: ParB/RepB/Spo0J family partition protein [Cytophagaceae bacterium]|jgi:ParB family chromosome partitioning protein|nr:ParB/RepB/Spo0J family partition protein [Cytophagaceae bacterium]
MNISNVVDVPMGEIRLAGINVRSDLKSEFSREGINELADNIKINGLLQPIVLKGIQGKPPYDVIVGQRRYLAHQQLKEKTIKATFSGDLNEMQSLLLSLSENMCRQEMNFNDISIAITKLYNHFEKDEYKVKAHTGFSIQTIRSHVKIEELATEKIKGFLSQGKITMADAKRAIDASQGDRRKADQLIDELAKLTKYEKNRLVEAGSKNPKASAAELLEDAKKPRLEETLILNLPPKIHKALLEASQRLSLEVEEVTMNALVSWLQTNEFLAA